MPRSSSVMTRRYDPAPSAARALSARAEKRRRAAGPSLFGASRHGIAARLVSTPSNSPPLPSLLRSSTRASSIGECPISCGRPMSCDRCRLRPAIAIWLYDFPTARSSTPESISSVVAVVSFQVVR